jgi:2-phospho-L-lactate/phosphoenolpyruvate guanylyltransferase
MPFAENCPAEQRQTAIVVPFRLIGAKSRLSPALHPGERRQLAVAMLGDVLRAVRKFGDVTILTRPGFDLQGADGSSCAFCDLKILESELDLNEALNEFIARRALHGWPEDLLIVMADLALLSEEEISGILGCPGDVVLCPGRGGGTNMILIRCPEFRTCYTGLSYPKHLDFARRAGLKASIYESFRAGCDIDEPDDLAEVLLHGQGEAKALLTEFGFSLSENARDSAGAAPIIRRCAPPDSRAQRQF